MCICVCHVNRQIRYFPVHATMLTQVEVFLQCYQVLSFSAELGYFYSVAMGCVLVHILKHSLPLLF